MNIPLHSLAEVVAERTLHIKDSDQLAREVAAYLLSENRTSDLESLMRDIMQYREDHGIVEAIAVSAHDLNDEIINDIKAILREHNPQAKSFIVRQKHDPAVIGGIRIKLANQQLDMTIRSKLDTFKRLTASGKE